jgi:hypothetical protein
LAYGKNPKNIPQLRGQCKIVAAHTFTMFCFQEKVIDFVLLEDEGDSVVKMMMITQRQTNVDVDVRTLLQIREFPSFNVLYELEASQLFYLFPIILPI